MDYTLQGIRQRVIVDKLDDEEFDPDLVDRFINDTQRDIFNQFELRFQEKIFKGTIPLGQTMFKFPDDVALIQAQIMTSPTGQQEDMQYKYMDFRTFNAYYPTPDNETPGTLGAWTLYGGNMLLSNPLKEDYIMSIFYIKKPALLQNPGDVPEIPEEFAELLVLGAFLRIQQRNEDYDLAAVTQQAYNNLLDMLVSRYGSRSISGPIKMKNSQR